MINEVGFWFHQLSHMTFFKNILVCKLHTTLELNTFSPNLNFKAYVEVDISSVEFRIRKYFQENSSGHTHDVIFVIFVKCIVNVSFGKYGNSIYQQIIESRTRTDFQTLSIRV